MYLKKNLKKKLCINLCSCLICFGSFMVNYSVVNANSSNIPKREISPLIVNTPIPVSSINSNSNSNTNAITNTNTINTADKNAAENDLKSVIINWHEIPNAVRYELKIKNADTKQTVFTKYDIYASGYQLDNGEVDLSQKLIWQVRGLDYNKVPVSDYTDLKWLTKGRTYADNWQEKISEKQTLDSEDIATSKIEYTTYLVKNNADLSPLKLTTHFSEMDYMPIYPVYSWVPTKNADYYKIDVFKENPDGEAEPIETLKTSPTMDYYDNKAYTQAGKYYFNVQAYDNSNNKIAQSANSYFTVKTDNVNIAALGDSITHGGGAISTPPSATLYNWETYADVPILNIGFSGNLTSNMVNRFDNDVLPFSPKLLVIMGGVNDIRTGIKANTVIDNLKKINEKCLQHNIVPVFLTVTPINPPKMVNNGKIEKPSSSWQQERIKINDWVKAQPFYVDIADAMADERGFLKDELTTDGLHPDYEGKKHIGEAVGDYLRLYFPYLTE